MSLLTNVSRKVSFPAALLAVGGAAVIVCGVLIGDGQLITLGVGLLSASGVTGVVGYTTTDPQRFNAVKPRRAARRRDRAAARRKR